jgi:hypothetical protein
VFHIYFTYIDDARSNTNKVYYSIPFYTILRNYQSGLTNEISEAVNGNSKPVKKTHCLTVGQ